MGVINYGGILVHGNFEDVQPSKPVDFDYTSEAKWIEPYSMEWREVLGDAICNCKTVEVHFNPYFGMDYYHRNYCNLMRKLKAQPQIHNIREVYLPRMTQWSDSVLDAGPITIWVQRFRCKSKINVRTSPVKDVRQGVLL